ncbi:unnamed protein product [Durusdinium trenchii]|uniref:Uncharacterized protein n=2 Tax=Durusdinium trenchii TaxID=1381693 RepID=A0ABP0R0Z0_9DINO
MVEFSPAYCGGTDASKLFEVRLQSEASIRDNNGRTKRLLPPTIPTLPLRRTSPRRVVKTYFVGVFQSSEPKKTRGTKKVIEGSEEQRDNTCEETAEIEHRIAYRAERASRYASDRAFPVLTSNDILPEWQGQSETPKGISKPTLVFLRRKKTVELDKVGDKKERTPWRPSAGRKAPEHPAYMSSAPGPQTARAPKRPVADRRKSLTTKELETHDKREAGRKRASELNERVLSNVRRNSTQSVSLAEFHDKIRKAGEASRAKDEPPEIEDETERGTGEGSEDVLNKLPPLNLSRVSF